MAMLLGLETGTMCFMIWYLGVQLLVMISFSQHHKVLSGQSVISRAAKFQENRVKNKGLMILKKLLGGAGAIYTDVFVSMGKSI